jgi:hypothetical protein
MNDVFKKLNYKDQKVVHILHAPSSFRKVMDSMEGTTAIRTSLPESGQVEFVLSFVTRQNEVDSIAKKIASLTPGDAVIWFAYPKGTSKNYTCEFNRDNGWAELGKAGYEPVRMVAIDDDFSALRFRRVAHIKKMTRSKTISAQGKQKARSK